MQVIANIILTCGSICFHQIVSDYRQVASYARADYHPVHMARFHFGFRKVIGGFSVSMQTKNEVAQEAIEEALAQIRHIRDHPVGVQDLQDAKAYLTGCFALRLDTNKKIAGMLASVEFYGPGLD